MDLRFLIGLTITFLRIIINCDKITEKRRGPTGRSFSEDERETYK